jgi:EamA domain-containing membrane protein RarD
MTIDIDEAKVNRNEFGLWLAWTLATMFGMLLGFLLSIPLVNLLDIQWARIIIPVLAGFVIGLLQWLALRNYLIDGTDWVLAGGTSWALGFALGIFVINTLADTAFGGVLGYLLFGFIVAIVQWPILRREIPNVWAWILANVVG